MGSEIEEDAGRPGMRPNHPGVSLGNVIKRKNIAKARLATHLGVSRQTLYLILNSERAVTADMAARLGRAFGNSPRFWLNLQAAYDTWEAEADPDVKKIKRLPELVG
jgi:antitoxin HigA-1